MAIARLCEPRTRTEMEARSHKVTDFGQGMVSEETRKLLRAAHPPDLGRWPADFRVRTNGALDCYVDAKFSYPHNRNVSIEMRSVLAARLQSVPWFYACSVWDGRDFSGFKSINSAAMPLSRGCCTSCVGIFHDARGPIEANSRLPEKCPAAQASAGSGTPYFLVLADSFPYGDLLFDRQPWRGTAGRGHGCSLCGAEHESCAFVSASLYCTKAACGNPHHRPDLSTSQ